MKSAITVAPCFVTLVFSIQDAGDPSVEQLISQLDGLREDCTRDEFLKRPALMELIAQYDRPGPALARAVESSPSWSIRASAAYVLGVNKFEGRMSGSYFSWDDLLRKERHTTVRMIAARARERTDLEGILLEKAVRDVEDRIFPAEHAMHVDGKLDWMAEEYYRRRLQRILNIAGSVNPLVHPLGEERPSWYSQAIHYVPLADMAFTNVFDEIQWSSHGHEVCEGLLALLVKETSVETGRLGYLFQMTLAISNHSGPQHRNGDFCLLSEGYSKTVLKEIEKWIWNIQDPFSLSQMTTALGSLVGDLPWLELAQRLAKEHPDPELREAAEGIIKHYEHVVAASASRELDREDWLKEVARRRAEREKRYLENAYSIKTRANGYPPDKHTDSQESKNASGDPRRSKAWLLIIPIVIILGSGAYHLAKRIMLGFKGHAP